jgi:hypothetical protein
MFVILFAAMLSWLVSVPQFAAVKTYFPIEFLYSTTWGWVVILFAMLAYLKPTVPEGMEAEHEYIQESLRRTLQSSVVLYVLIVLVLGFDALYWFFAFLLLKPFLLKLKVLGKITDIFKKGKAAIAEQAKAAAAKGVEAPELAGTAGEAAAKLTKSVGEKDEVYFNLLSDKIDSVQGNIENLAGRQQAAEAQRQKDALEAYKERKDELGWFYNLLFKIPVIGWLLGILIFKKQHNAYKKLQKASQSLKTKGVAVGGFSLGPVLSRLTRYAFILLLAVGVVVFVFPALNINLGQQALAAETYVSSGRMFLDLSLFFRNAVQKLTGVVQAPAVWWEQQLEIFHQDAFITQVDESANRKLGLFWEDITQAERQFTRGREAYVWGNLRGELLDINKCFENMSNPECIVNTRCRVKNAVGVETVPGKISMLDLAGSGESITCSFVPRSEGVLTVNFIADFTFETLGYIPMYFADRSLVLQYAAQKKDILDEEGITEKQPVSRYTPGPVAVGIESFSSMPIRIYVPFQGTGAVIGETGPAAGTTLGVSLQNQWRIGGELQNITNLTIIVPDSLSLEDCTPAEFRETAHDTAKGERHFSIDPGYLKRQTAEKDVKSFRCRMDVAEGKRPEDILVPGSPVTLRAIKVIAKYQFAITKEHNVQVGAGEEPSITYSAVQEASLKAYDVCSPNVTKCSDYDSESYCSADPCGKKCYWDIGILTNACTNCPSSPSCSVYESRDYCDLDSCQFGCDWSIEGSQCKITDVRQTLKWPTDLFIVKECGSDYIIIQGARYVYAVESGTITSEEGKITIQHPGGYRSEYMDLLERYRISGNAAKKTVIARLKDQGLKFRLSTPSGQLTGQQILNLFKEELGYTIRLEENSKCT